MSEKTSIITSPHWNPYIVGAAIGILSWMVFFVVDKPLGMSTEISKWSGATTSIVAGSESVNNNAYWAKTTPKLGYSTIFLITTAVGAFASAILSKDFKIELVPQVWADRFGPSASKRYLGAFIGGILLMFGARMAGGCTSGHGISGSLQLAVSSWIFFITMFIGGVIAARVLFPTNQ